MNAEKLARIADSLKKSRRAELRDFEDELGMRPIDAVYVDPLPNDAILNSVISGNTTFLLGRKGTGKSTVFAKAQSTLRQRRDVLSTYIDVKSLHDMSDAAAITPSVPENLQVDVGFLRFHMLRKAFLGAVLADLLKEIDAVSNVLSLWDRWSGRKKSFLDLKNRLAELESRVKQSKLHDLEVPILQRISTRWKARQQKEESHKTEGGIKAGLSSTGLQAGIHATAADFDKSLDDNELYNEYSDLILRSFPFEEIIQEIQDLLAESGLKRLVVFFDDFSELDFVAQRLFVDVILSPLNNSSNEAVKLKIAGYPGRVYYGRIDPSKVDTICLDFSALYEASEVQTMEQSAIDYATRLLTKRFEAFGENIADYFQSSVPLEQHMRLLFETTFNVPRLMGALLSICNLDRVSKGQPITPASLRLAAQKYYESTILQYFDRMHRFALEPFENKLDRHNQRELLNCIVEKARNVHKEIRNGSAGGRAYFSNLKNPPVSHFTVNPVLGEVLQALESNFLVSKYKDARDKSGKAVSVYALYYGLTESENLAWGYPPGRDYRDYFRQRCFDYTGAIHEFLSRSQTIRCGSCGKCYPLDQKPSLELYRWECPDCRNGFCRIVNLGDDFRAEVETLSEELMLDEIELKILSALHEEGRAMLAGEISVLIDVTHQLVGKRTSRLQDRGLVEKKRSPEDGKMRSQITEKAKTTYFE